MEIYNTKISYYKNHMQVKVYDNSVKKGEKENQGFSSDVRINSKRKF